MESPGLLYARLYPGTEALQGDLESLLTPGNGDLEALAEEPSPLNESGQKGEPSPHLRGYGESEKLLPSVCQAQPLVFEELAVLIELQGGASLGERGAEEDMELFADPEARGLTLQEEGRRRGGTFGTGIDDEEGVLFPYGPVEAVFTLQNGFVGSRREVHNDL